jgi:Zn-dependent M28 family amino/carboxypeptidase
VRRLLISAATMTVAALLLAPAALAAPDDVNTQRLRNGVTTSGILNHMRALQRAANANDGNRAANTTGYEASLDYVERRMNRAGYETELVPFDFAEWTQNAPATLQLGSTVFTEGQNEGGDYVIAQFSGSGTVTGPIVPIDYTAPPPAAGASTSGCEESDFPANPAPNSIALIQRGTCNFVDKIALAAAAGYAAVLIANDGFPDRIEPFQIGAEPFTAIPVAMTSSGVGQQLVAAAGQTLTFAVDTTTTESVQHNLIADTPTGNPERTTVVGAHLDSVEEGPGINDNGSGSSTLIEIAEEIAELPRNPRNRIRFAWWGAEEAGLVGSTAYVADLLESGDIDDIEANLNFDMLASPNFVRFVYDGDNSTDEGAAGPPGSAEIEQVFLDYFESAGLETTPTAFDGRSDYGPFIAPEAYVAAGGLFSGAEGVKTAEEEATYGGAAGSWYDPCYHQFCDTFSTVVYEPPFVPGDPDASATGLEEGSEAADAAAMQGNGPIGLGQLADGAADATWTLARSQSPLVGPAAAQTARVGGSARKRYRKAYRRAAKHRVYQGGQVIR